MKKIREMEYKNKHDVALLDSGKCFGYDYYIISLGTHPTAYIKIPSCSSIYKKTYDEIYKMGYCLPVNGGLTYSNNQLCITPINELDWYIGWDYAHYGDFFGFDLNFQKLASGKKWTTKEIKKEVFNACLYLKNNKI